MKHSPPGKRKPLGSRCTVLPLGQLHQLLQLARRSTRRSRTRAGPRSTCDLEAERRGDRRRRLAGPLQRRRVDARRPSSARRSARPPPRACSARVGEVQAGGPAGQHLAGGGRLPVADEQHERSAAGAAVLRQAWCAGLNLRRAVRGIRLARAARRRESSPAGPARGSSRGASRWPSTSAAAFRDEEYWGRPLPGFGDPAARIVVVGLAPGRARRQPHRAGVHRRPLGRLAVPRAAPRRLRQPADESVRRDDGLRADATRGSPPRCAARRRPTSRRPTSANVPAVPRARARAARPGCASSCARRVRPTTGGRAVLGVRPAPKLRPRRRGRRCRDGRDARCARSTRASRTPSPAGSPSRCSTPSSPASNASQLLNAVAVRRRGEHVPIVRAQRGGAEEAPQCHGAAFFLGGGTPTDTRGVGELRPAAAAHDRQRAQQLHRLLVGVGRARNDGARRDHARHDLTTELGAHEHERPVVVLTDAAG